MFLDDVLVAVPVVVAKAVYCFDAQTFIRASVSSMFLFPLGVLAHFFSILVFLGRAKVAGESLNFVPKPLLQVSP